MKIFQIGFNKCGTRFLHQLFTDQGYKSIYADDGRLARRMFENFLNMDPLLKGYEHYDCFLCMENVAMNLYPHLLFYKLLDQQYPGSKFILNTRNVENWIKSRLNQPGYLTDYMWSTGTTKTAVAVEKWRSLWKRHHEEVKAYFGKRICKDLLIFHVEEEHPIKVYFFLSDKNYVRARFQQLYDGMFQRRISNVGFDLSPSSSSRFDREVDVYCVAIPDRRQQIEATLQEFGCTQVNFFDGLQKEDITKHDYQKLSTVHFIGPNVAPCNICRYVNAHSSLHGKPTKLAVHLSYISCIHHAVTHSDKDYVLIFEDDIYFDVTKSELDVYLDEFHEQGYDVMYLGFCYCKKGESLKPASSMERLICLPPNQSISCKHAILYRRSYMKNLLPDLLPLTCPSDSHINHLNIIRRAKVAIPDRGLVFQDRVHFQSLNDSKEPELPLFN